MMDLPFRYLVHPVLGNFRKNVLGLSLQFIVLPGRESEASMTYS